jgi:uncharacterized protein (DUF2267 family)
MAETHDSGSTQQVSESQSRRERRHESHQRQSYAAFMKHLRDLSGLPPALAECAAVSVLTALERRLMPNGARNLESQLPRLLVAFLPPPEDRGPSLHRFGKEELVASVAEDLQMPVDRAELVVRAVLRAFQDQISEGEADKVITNLPEDIQALWRLTQ